MPLNFVQLSSSSGTSVKSKLLDLLCYEDDSLTSIASGAVQSPIKLVKSRNLIEEIPVHHRY